MTEQSRSLRRRLSRRYPWVRWHEHIVSPQEQRWRQAAVGDHTCTRLQRRTPEGVRAALDARFELLDRLLPDPDARQAFEGIVLGTPYYGPWLPWHKCPTCGIERTDHEGPDRHLPTCPNCGSPAAPVPGE